ncbi:hypothetical protein BDY21DRAFT_145632 [Lineolata rhizophorae]|uniref:Uncharacterized protein n=1 Tax=Lineolata rhizophorae TaxID=578093 RepID=A0A6A6NN17_9PEZI|nr:hypothetical protein BDY21DRAFT_145632 [Lineolata rhizophorae]
MLILENRNDDIEPEFIGRCSQQNFKCFVFQTHAPVVTPAGRQQGWWWANMGQLFIFSYIFILFRAPHKAALRHVRARSRTIRDVLAVPGPLDPMRHCKCWGLCWRNMQLARPQSREAPTSTSQTDEAEVESTSLKAFCKGQSADPFRSQRKYLIDGQRRFHELRLVRPFALLPPSTQPSPVF